MAAANKTVWDLESHTRAKHAILERYLKAWMPILSHAGFPEILYIDGFAGPGEYSKGEDGSPIISLKTALGYDPPLSAKFHFLFVEKDKNRAENLKSIIDGFALPRNFEVVVEPETTFEEAFVRHHGRLTQLGRRMPPTFAFIDPFGWKGVPFAIVEKIMRHASCEVFINFMYEEINRFLGHPDQVENFNSYFGTDLWSQIVGIETPRERNRQLHDLYVEQLRGAAGVQFVRSFEMRNERDVTDYFLFYATNSRIGLQKMKEAMWKIDEFGEFSFSDATNQDQFVLFEKSPDFGYLRKQIVARFSTQPATIREIEDFVLMETAFRETHYKRQVLAPLEKDGTLEIVSASPNRRKGQYGDPNMIILLRT